MIVRKQLFDVQLDVQVLKYLYIKKYCCRCHGFQIDDYDVQFNPLKL